LARTDRSPVTDTTQDRQGHEVMSPTESPSHGERPSRVVVELPVRKTAQLADDGFPRVTSTGKVYCAAVLDVFTRKIVGWSIADHMRSELVVDALQMAIWRRHPAPGAIVHADRGSQYTSWIFGHRLRAAGLLGSMGRVASSVDNTMMESFWSTMQRELLDRRTWSSREELASAIFEWIEGFYNRVRRHSGLGYRSPNDFEDLHTTATAAA
jgi:transposase InsO family protein